VQFNQGWTFRPSAGKQQLCEAGVAAFRGVEVRIDEHQMTGMPQNNVQVAEILAGRALHSNGRSAILPPGAAVQPPHRRYDRLLNELFSESIADNDAR